MRRFVSKHMFGIAFGRIVVAELNINDVIFSECENKLFCNLLRAIIIQHSHTFIIWNRPIFDSIVKRTETELYLALFLSDTNDGEKSWKGATSHTALYVAINNSYPKQKYIQRQHIKIIKSLFRTREIVKYGHIDWHSTTRGERNMCGTATHTHTQ